MTVEKNTKIFLVLMEKKHGFHSKLEKKA